MTSYSLTSGDGKVETGTLTFTMSARPEQIPDTPPDPAVFGDYTLLLDAGDMVHSSPLRMRKVGCCPN